MNAKLLQQIRRTTTYMDRMLGIKAVYRTGFNVNSTSTAKNVVVRSKPLSIRERNDITQAGLTDIDAAWFMQVTYHSDVKPGHVLEVPVGGFKYEIKSATTDELNIEHTIYSRRMK